MPLKHAYTYLHAHILHTYIPKKRNTKLKRTMFDKNKRRKNSKKPTTYIKLKLNLYEECKCRPCCCSYCCCCVIQIHKGNNKFYYINSISNNNNNWTSFSILMGGLKNSFSCYIVCSLLLLSFFLVLCWFVLCLVFYIEIKFFCLLSKLFVVLFLSKSLS